MQAISNEKEKMKKKTNMRKILNQNENMEK